MSSEENVVQALADAILDQETGLAEGRYLKAGDQLIPVSAAAAGGEHQEAFIQWKGTDACLDLYCTCGEQFHFDGYFADELTCGHCGQTWKLPHMLAIEPVEPSRQLKLVFDGREVIRAGEFGVPWPRPQFGAVQPGGILEVHDDIHGAHRSTYADFLGAEDNGDGTMTLRVRNRDPRWQ